MSGVKVTVAATKMPISLQEAKQHLRVTENDEDAHITNLINAATNYAETVTKTALMEQTVQWYLDCFHCFTLEFPISPLQSVSFIKYKHPTTGALTTLDPAEYVTDLISAPGRVQPAYGKTWPTTRDEINAVQIELVAGYTQAKQVPFNVRQALLMLVAHWYENREASLSGTIISEVPIGVSNMLHSERVWAR